MNENNVNEVVEEVINQGIEDTVVLSSESDGRAKGIVTGVAAVALMAGAIYAGKKAFDWIKDKVTAKKSEKELDDEDDDDLFDDEDDVKSEETE